LIARVLQIVALEVHARLPDSWVLTPTNITIGDVRELAAEVVRLQAVLADRKRSELIEVASRMSGSPVEAVASAAKLIESCDRELADPGSSQREVEEIRARRMGVAREWLEKK
jgi:hypothetical protein